MEGKTYFRDNGLLSVFMATDRVAWSAWCSGLFKVGIAHERIWSEDAVGNPGKLGGFLSINRRQPRVVRGCGRRNQGLQESGGREGSRVDVWDEGYGWGVITKKVRAAWLDASVVGARSWYQCYQALGGQNVSLAGQVGALALGKFAAEAVGRCRLATGAEWGSTISRDLTSWLIMRDNAGLVRPAAHVKYGLKRKTAVWAWMTCAAASAADTWLLRNVGML